MCVTSCVALVLPKRENSKSFVSVHDAFVKVSHIL